MWWWCLALQLVPTYIFGKSLFGAISQAFIQSLRCPFRIDCIPTEQIICTGGKHSERMMSSRVNLALVVFRVTEPLTHTLFFIPSHKISVMIKLYLLLEYSELGPICDNYLKLGTSERITKARETRISR